MTVELVSAFVLGAMLGAGLWPAYFWVSWRRDRAERGFKSFT